MDSGAKVNYNSGRQSEKPVADAPRQSHISSTGNRRNGRALQRSRHDPTIMPVSDNCRGSGLWQDRRMDAVSSYNETPRMASA